MRRLALAVLLPLLAALPAQAQQAAPLRLSCRADGAAAQAEPLILVIDLLSGRATEAGSGARFGVTPYRDGLGLWDAEAGPGQVVYRLDSLRGRFARVGQQTRLEGSCEKVEDKR
jgi:hypothetical protein